MRRPIIFRFWGARHVLNSGIRSRSGTLHYNVFPVVESKQFHCTPRRRALKTQNLTDIGEGISEVQIIQWFVSEGAHVEEWSPLLEVQSDKAADTITSRFAGVVRKLYAKQDDTVKTGSALCDIEAEGEVNTAASEPHFEQGETDIQDAEQQPSVQTEPASVPVSGPQERSNEPELQPVQRSKHAALATPAVRGLLKEHKIDILDISGTGKDGRVTKEDVQNYVSSQGPRAIASTSTQATPPSPSKEQVETPQKLTPVQAAMFRTMTASLQIPHFLYSDDINVTSLSILRNKLNTLNQSDSSAPHLTYLPFILKALSLTLHHFPLLNSRLDSKSSPSAPQLIHRSSHNINIAVDTPSGLLVPVLRAVQTQTINSLAQDISRLTALGRAGKLATTELTGGTITVSNVGSLSGNVISPIVVEGQVAILGVGKARPVPVFDEHDNVVKAQMMTLSWCADHRVVDGATVAKAGAMVKGFLEEPGRMMLNMN